MEFKSYHCQSVDIRIQNCLYACIVQKNISNKKNSSPSHLGVKRLTVQFSEGRHFYEPVDNELLLGLES